MDAHEVQSLMMGFTGGSIASIAMFLMAEKYWNKFFKQKNLLQNDLTNSLNYKKMYDDIVQIKMRLCSLETIQNNNFDDLH